VYEDVDGNGLQDMFAGELGLPGWTVELYWSGRLIASTTSDADGKFWFLNLGNSTWTVCVIGLAGYTRTQPLPPPDGIGNACGGAGYEFPLNGQFQTEFRANFGFMLP